MPNHTIQRSVTLEEHAFLQALLSRAPTTAGRWRRGLSNAFVLWAASLMGCTFLWLVFAGLARHLSGVDYGFRSPAAPWIFGIAARLCATYAAFSSVRWVMRWTDMRPSLSVDLATAQVVEEHYVFDAAKRFQEPEHGGLIYFLHTLDDRVLTLYDPESQDLGVQDGDPLASSFKPMSRLVMVRAPETRYVISMRFSGDPLDAGALIGLAIPPDRWPETEEYCDIPWAELETVLGPPA